MMRHNILGRLAIGLSLAGCMSLGAVMATAQSSGQQQLSPALTGLDRGGIPYGTAPADDTRGGEADDLGDLKPGISDDGRELVFQNTRFATNGVSMRNCRCAGINLVGIPPRSTIVAAYLYWDYTSLVAPTPGLQDTMRIRRRCPRPIVKAKVVGTIVGVGADPCWFGDSNFAFRADLLAQAPGLVTGGGTYFLSHPPGAAGLSDYSDPNISGAAPLLEGATMVVVYNNDVEPMGTTHIYDGAPLSGFEFEAFPGLTYNLIPTVAITAEARWANIGADGQAGSLFNVGSEFALGLCTGTLLAGDFSAYNDSLWNGSGNTPLGQLWDTHGIDVTAEVACAGTFPVLHADPGGAVSDCLVEIVNVLWIR